MNVNVKFDLENLSFATHDYTTLQYVRTTSIVIISILKLCTVSGYGKFHYFLLTTCGFVSTSEEMDVISMSFILPSAQCDLNLNTHTKGWLNCIIFIGKKFGYFYQDGIVQHCVISSTIFKLLLKYSYHYFRICLSPNLYMDFIDNSLEIMISPKQSEYFLFGNMFIEKLYFEHSLYFSVMLESTAIKLIHTE